MGFLQKESPTYPKIVKPTGTGANAIATAIKIPLSIDILSISKDKTLQDNSTDRIFEL